MSLLSNTKDSTPSAGLSPQPWGALAIMAALIVMSMIDRLILALLVKPLKADLGLSDVQLGLLFGTAFAVFYGVMGLPIARIADKHHRVRLITIAVVLWSICTILSGFATTFEELLLLRAGLAIGEAALFPTVHSLIFDMFDVRRRPFAASLITAAAPLGGALAFVAGGGLVDLITGFVGESHAGFRPWQLVFFSVGAPSLALGMLFFALVREPVRTARQGQPAPAKAFEALAGRKAMFVLLLLAGGVCQVVPYAYQAWAPTLLTEKYGLSMSQAGLLLGLAGSCGAILGTFAVPLLVVRLYDLGKRWALTSVPVVVVLCGTIAFIAAPLQSDIALMLVAYFMGSFAMLGTNATVFVALQRLAPDHLRATLVAAGLLVSSSLGLGLGPIGVAYVANSVVGEPRFDLALSAIAALMGVVALAFFALAGRSIARQP